MLIVLLIDVAQLTLLFKISPAKIEIGNYIVNAQDTNINKNCVHTLVVLSMIDENPHISSRLIKREAGVPKTTVLRSH